jgi:acetyl esterase/lipase
MKRVLAIASAFIACLTSRLGAAGNGPSALLPDGTIEIRELTLPPSGFWSPEYARFNAGLGAAARAISDLPIPARDAPKAEWDEFDARVDKRYAEPLSKLLRRYPVNVEDTRLAGVHVGIITPRGGIPAGCDRRVLMNLHGGGFLINRGLTFGQMESVPVSAIGRIKVVTVDYRQAPFFSYPAATDDAVSVYEALLRHYPAQAIGIYGSSAGGILAAQVVARLIAERMSLPGAVGILSASPPGTPDRKEAEGDSRVWAAGLIPATHPLPADSKTIEPFTWYMKDARVDDVQAFPASSDAMLARFPATLLLTGTRERGFSPVIVAHTRLLRLGVDASLYVMEGATHVAHVMAVETPEAHEANAYIARWFDTHLRAGGCGD